MERMRPTDKVSPTRWALTLGVVAVAGANFFLLPARAAGRPHETSPVTPHAGTCSENCDRKAAECLDGCEAKYKEDKARVECKLQCTADRQKCESACTSP
jgi:hypothetical protein